VKSVLGEFSSSVSICRNQRTWSDLGTPFLPSGQGVRGALPPALKTGIDSVSFLPVF